MEVIAKTDRIKGMAEELAIIKKQINNYYSDNFYTSKIKKYIKSIDNIQSDIVGELNSLVNYLNNYAEDVEYIEYSVKEDNIYSTNVSDEKLFEVKTVTSSFDTVLPKLANNIQERTLTETVSYTNKSSNASNNNVTTEIIDVGSWEYCYDAVNWCNKNNILMEVKKSENKLGPSDPATRKDTVNMLYHLEKVINGDSSNLNGGDINWAQRKRIIKGYENGDLSLYDNVSRGQFITMLWRLAGCPEPTGNASFDDVDENKYYTKAINWAYNLGIARGINEFNFNPNAKVTKAQASTFIYRYVFIFYNDLVNSKSTMFNQIYNDKKYGGNQSNVPKIAEQYLITENVIKLIITKQYRILNSLYTYDEIANILGEIFNLSIETFRKYGKSDFSDEWIRDRLLNGEYNMVKTVRDLKAKQIVDVARKYYPKATATEIKNMTEDYAKNGCGYMAFANTFAEFMGSQENGEELFKEKMGYDLIIRDINNNPSVNLETIAFDFFLWYHQQEPDNCKTPKDLHNKAHGVINYDRSQEKNKLLMPDAIKNYCQEKGIKTDIYFKNNFKTEKSLTSVINEYKAKDYYVLLGANKFDLKGLMINTTSNRDNALRNSDFNGKDYTNVGGHEMTITDLTDNNEIIVSSWSNKYKFVATSNTFDINLTILKFSLE